MKKIVHIDINCFFAQAEVLKDTSLSNKPIAVGYDGNRGVLSTCSYEARKYGIHSGMPTKEAKRILPQLIVIQGDYNYYSELSSRLFEYLKKDFPILEVASIDECYIDMSSALQDKNEEEEMDYLRDLQMNIYKYISLKCSIGLGDSKFLAKMASDYKKPLGITIIHKKDISKYLYPLDISAMYGIGIKTSPRLKKIGINTIGDLAKKDEAELKLIFGNTYQHYIDCLNGTSSDVVTSIKSKPKSISSERTFYFDVSDIDEIMDMEKLCLDECYKELKKVKAKTKTVMIKYRDLDFKTFSKRFTNKEYFKNKNEIFQTIEQMFDDNYDGRSLRLVGVGLENLKYDEITSKKDEDIKLF